MKRKMSEEAYYDRLKDLANVKKTSINENKSSGLGTLIDFKRSNDGIAYGLVKENHKYYIKKGGLKKELNLSDFVYITGLGNVTQYQYNSLAEADKNRNMLLGVVNESTTFKLNENKISDEIEQAEKKLDAAEIATNEPIEEPSNDEPIDIPSDDEPTDIPSDDEGIDEPIEEPSDDEEIDEPIDDEEIDNEPSDDDGKKDEIKSEIGKIGDKIQKKSLTDSQVKSYVNMFLGYFKEYFLKMEQTLLNNMAEKINALQKEKNIDSLQKDVVSEPTHDIENITEDDNIENGFIEYAESRGYDRNSMLECSVDEMGSLISGYANSYDDGENNGDHKTVALFLKLMPKVLEVLKNEYGCDEYISELEPEVNSLEDTSDEELQEALGGALWGGLKTIGKGITDPIKRGAERVGTAVNKGMENIKQGAATQSRKQDIRTGTKKRNVYLDKVQTKANELIGLIQQANTGAAKAGQEPINVGSLLSTIRNQIAGSGNVNLSKYKMESSSEMTNTEILPNDETCEISESEKKLRKYIRSRLEEISGLKKTNINESKKSPNLKKLDVLIENQFKLYNDLKKKETDEKNSIDEFLGFSKKEKFEKLNSNDENAVLKFIENVFSEEFNNPYGGALRIALKLTPNEKRYNILKQYFDNNSNGTIARDNETGELVYTLKSPFIKGNSLSGKGFNAGY